MEYEINKRCSKCGGYKPLAEFNTDKNHKDGKRSECKQCQWIKINEWNIKNKEWRKTRDAKYHREHYFKGYRKEYHQRWYQGNKERINKLHKEYRSKNKGAAAMRTAKYRQSKLELECTFTNSQWDTLKLLFKNRCAYCGKRTKRLEREHIIPVSSGGSLALQNIVPACRSCNAKKGTNLPEIPINLVLL